MSDYPDLLMFVRLIQNTNKPTAPQEHWAVVTETEARAGTAVIDGATAEPRFFNKLRSSLALCQPGAVYQVKLTEKSVEFTKRARPIFSYGDKDKVAQWQAETTAVERVVKAEVALEDSVIRRRDREALEPLRTAYRRANGQARVQMLAEFVRYITSHSAL